jgi:hypothetical protein
MTNITVVPQNVAPSFNTDQTSDIDNIGSKNNLFPAAPMRSRDAAGFADSELNEKEQSLSIAPKEIQAPESKKISAIGTASTQLITALIDSKDGVSLPLSQTCMEVQRASAWARVLATAKTGEKTGDTTHVAQMAEHLHEAMAVEASIASTAMVTLQAAQNGAVELDAPTEIELNQQLVRFLQVADRLEALASDDADQVDQHSDSHLFTASAASQLEAWSKNSDIGTEVLRLYMNALIRMRESLRESRQLALSFYTVHADAAIVALKKQGQDNWMKEILSAVGLIVSGVIQLVPLIAMPIHARMKRHARVDAYKVKEPGAKKNAEPPSPTREERDSKKNRIAQDNNSEIMQMHNNLAYFRALGEIAQGSFNIGAAFYGLYASNDGVEHFSQNAEMQKQIFQRDKWSVEADMMTRSIEQVASTINDLQTRQTDSISKLNGRV